MKYYLIFFLIFNFSSSFGWAAGSLKLSAEPWKSVEEFVAARRSVISVLSQYRLEEIQSTNFDYLKGGIDFVNDILETDKVVPLSEVDEYCGTCPNMEHGHLSAIFSNEEYPLGYGSDQSSYGRLVFVYMEGKLFGIIKFSGNPSFLALRTVRDSKGRHPLIIGGVYVLPREILGVAERIQYKQPYWGRLDIDTLKVYPLTQLGKHWNPRKDCQLLLVAKGNSRTEWYQNFVPRLIEFRKKMERKN